MQNLAILTIMTALTLLTPSGSAQADGPFLDVSCLLTDDSTVLVDIGLNQESSSSDGEVLDLIVTGVFVEAHSKPGNFWIQLNQPTVPDLTFDLCGIFGSASIDPAEIDAARFFVTGKAFGAGDPIEVKGRCENLPPPKCMLIE